MAGGSGIKIVSKGGNVIYEGTVGVHRTFSGNTPVFDVFFAPNVDGGACNSRRFRDLEELVGRTLEEVCAGRSASIAHVTLSDRVIAEEGLDSSVTMKRRIN